jgi:hypothetical protein
MVDAGAREGTGTVGGDDEGRGGEVELGATVEAAVVDDREEEVVKGINLELNIGAGVAEEVGIAGVGAVVLKMSTALEGTSPLPAHNNEYSKRTLHTTLHQRMHPAPTSPSHRNPPCNHRNNSHTTYRRHQRRSRVLDSAAT